MGTEMVTSESRELPHPFGPRGSLAVLRRSLVADHDRHAQTADGFISAIETSHPQLNYYVYYPTLCHGCLPLTLSLT
jgi:hypothetical protein